MRNDKRSLTLKIKRMGINGEGIAFYNKTLVFIPGALKGEEVCCQIVSRQKNFMIGRLIRVLKASKERVTPLCPVYDVCGGCQLMHLKYSSQLTLKEDILRQALKKFKPSGYDDYEIRPTLGMSDATGYRAKLQFQIRKEKGRTKAGLYAPGSHRLVAIEECLVQDDVTLRVVTGITRLIDRHHAPVYDERNNHGIRTVMTRRSKKTGEIQVILVVSRVLDVTDLVAAIVREMPEVVTIATNIQPKKTSDIYGDKTEIVWGKKMISESVRGISFSLSPRAFYQLNPDQTEVLYQEVATALEGSGAQTIIDAYCGVGTIGLSLSNMVTQIRGVDVISEAIADARKSASTMGVDAVYEVGTAEMIIPKWYQEGFRADALIVDPPRAGLDDALLETILAYPTPTMIYVSCNASSLARDLRQLAKIYDVAYIQSVDMFPHTARVEAVVKLMLRT